MSRTNADIRKRQIDTLKIFNDNVMELKPNEQYSIGFSATGQTFQLDVHLSANFPNEAPQLLLSPLIHHPWVQTGSGAIQTAPGLVNFTIHSDLGRVVDAIIREFQRTLKSAPTSNSTDTNSPPQSVTQSASSSSSSSTTPTTAAATDNTGGGASATAQQHTTTAPTIHQPQQQQPHISLPDLSALTLDELRALNEDDLHLADFVEELATMQQLNQDIDTLLDDVEALTAANLSKEGALLERVAAKRQQQSAMHELGAAYELADQRYHEQSEQFAPAHINELLQIGAAEAETDCEAHVDAFLGKRLEASAFLERYIPAKVLGTVRKAKGDRLSQQLNALERAT